MGRNALNFSKNSVAEKFSKFYNKAPRIFRKNVIYFFLSTIAVAVIALAMKLCFKDDFFVKILILNSSTTLVSLFIALSGLFYGNETYIDIAVIYFSLGFVSNLAYANFLKNK